MQTSQLGVLFSEYFSTLRIWVLLIYLNFVSFLCSSYCMRVMMEEVPEGEWLCEECENELEYEKKKKLEKSQLKVGASKSQFFERKTNKIANASKSKSYEDETSKALEGKISKPDTALKNRSSFENEVENENGDKKELNSTNQCNNSNSKRKEEGAGIISSIKQSITERCGLSM